MLMYYQITKNCNYNCDYCVDHNNSKKQYTGTSIYSKICQFLNTLSLKNNKIFTVDIYGGEPTLHPNFFDIVDRLNIDNNRLVLFTNLSADITLYEKYIETVKHGAIHATYHPRHVSQSIFVSKLEHIIRKYPNFNVTIYCGIDNVRHINRYNFDEFYASIKQFISQNVKFEVYPIVYDDIDKSHIDNIRYNDMTIINDVNITKNKRKNIDVSLCIKEKGKIDPYGYLYQCSCSVYKYPLMDVKTNNAIAVYKMILSKKHTCDKLTCCYIGDRTVNGKTTSNHILDNNT